MNLTKEGCFARGERNASTLTPYRLQTGEDARANLAVRGHRVYGGTAFRKRLLLNARWSKWLIDSWDFPTNLVKLFERIQCGCRRCGLFKVQEVKLRSRLKSRNLLQGENWEWSTEKYRNVRLHVEIPRICIYRNWTWRECNKLLQFCEFSFCPLPSGHWLG